MTPEVQPEVLAATVTPPPEALRGRRVTHWSARRLAGWLARHRGIRVSRDSVAVLGRWICLQPHRSEGFKVSTAPALEARIRDVVGLYLDAQGVVVVCVDEIAQLQMLDRIALMLRMRPGQIERQPTTTPVTAPPPCSAEGEAHGIRSDDARGQPRPDRGGCGHD
jgi:hypothetical protein